MDGNRVVGSVIGCALLLATGACGGDDDDGDDGTTSDASLPDASAPDAGPIDPPDGGGAVDAAVDAGPEGIRF